MYYNIMHTYLPITALLQFHSWSLDLILFYDYTNKWLSVTNNNNMVIYYIICVRKLPIQKAVFENNQ
jgi:hypothetical protein